MEVSRGQKETEWETAAESCGKMKREHWRQMTKTDSCPPQSDSIYSAHTDPAVWMLKKKAEAKMEEVRVERKRCCFERRPRRKLEICCQRRHQCLTGWHSELNLTLWPSLIFLSISYHRHTLGLALIKKASPASKYVNGDTDTLVTALQALTFHVFCSVPPIFRQVLIIQAAKLQSEKKTKT